MRSLIALALMSATAHAEQELPTYPGTVHTRIGDDLAIGGDLYRIAYFVTPDPLPRVADFFFRQWRDGGYPTTVDGDGSREVVVSAFYTREGLQRAVVLRVHEGKTLGFCVLKDLWTRAEADLPPLATVEGTLYRADVAARDSAERSSLVGADVATARARVVSALQRDGFRVAKEHGGVLELSRGKDEILVVLTPIDPRLTAVMQTWVSP